MAKSITKRANKRTSLALPFAIPGHEWHPVLEQGAVMNRLSANHGGHELNGFVLVEKFSPSIEQKAARARRNLNEAKQGAGEFVAQQLGWGTKSAKILQANDAFRDLLALAAPALKPGKPVEPETAEALALITEFTSQGCELLAKIAGANPKALQPLARKRLRWPVMFSQQPRLFADPKIMLKSLEQGQETGLEVDSSAKWIDDDFSKIARELLEYLNTHKENPSLGEVHAESKLRALPTFDSDSAGAYWTEAKAVFSRAYPFPQNIFRLANLIRAKKDRELPSKVKARILQALKSRFINLAPPPLAYRT